MYTESETVRFSGEVTTAESDGIITAELPDCDLADAPEQITVVFDGTEYTCSLVDDEYYGSNGEEWTDYPFTVYINSGSTSLYTETASTHQVEIKAAKELINEDLADAIKDINSPFVVTFTVNQDGSTSADKRVSECLTAYHDGRRIIAKNGNEIGLLSSVQEAGYQDELVFRFIFIDGNTAQLTVTRVYYCHIHKTATNKEIISFVSGKFTPTETSLT